MRPTVWTATADDGWTRVAHEPAVFGLGGQMTDVVFHEDRLIAVGTYCDDTDCYAAAWSSVDGAVWSRTWLGEAETRPAALIAGEALVAVGDAFDSDGRVLAAAWTSPDGVDWTRAPHDEVVFGGGGREGFMEAAMNSIAASPTGDGSFVAGGWVIDGDGQWPRFWISPDGLTWQIASDLPPDGMVHDMATYDQTTVAVGSSIWRSDDGIGWQEMADMTSDTRAVSTDAFGWTTITTSSEVRASEVWVSPPPG
jgi:hypothetical protein